MTLGRQPITIVEIDLPLCSRVYGTAPCTAVLSAANPAKCFNTRATCQDVPNYLGVNTQTLRFAPNQSGLPKGQTIFPALKSVSSRASEINLSGIDPRTNALGKRARVTVNLQDFAYIDTLTDPYQSQRVSGAAQFGGVGYKPQDRGQFFARLSARQPYYVGKALRVKRGFVGDAIASMATSHYVITDWSGPDAGGAVQITAADVLDLADNVKAVAPKASRGKLSADMTISATTATLIPATVGAEYPTSGKVSIGREIVSFTRAGDVLTMTGRGLNNTTAAVHKISDVVQVCLEYVTQRPCDVISNLLTAFAGVSAAFINTAVWQAENDAWLTDIKLSRVIPRPVGVAQLIGEICQVGVMVWSEDLSQAISFRANRPLSPGETSIPLTDKANSITGTINVMKADEQRVSSLFFYHSVIDPTDAVLSSRNYDKLTIATVTDDLYGQQAIKEIFCPWFGTVGNETAAGVISERLLERYRTTPDVFTAMLDEKDSATIGMGTIVAVSSMVLQDATGAIKPKQMQVNMVERGSGRLQIKAETYDITGRFGFWMQDPQVQYDTTATATQKAEGAFWMDDTIGTFPDATGPYVWF